jgi:hypothetical protein
MSGAGNGRSTDMNLYHLLCKAGNGFGFRRTTGGTPGMHAWGDSNEVEAGSHGPRDVVVHLMTANYRTSLTRMIRTEFLA